MCDITISSWGSGCDIKQMIISFQCELAARHVSTIISRRITEALQRRGSEKDPSIAVDAFTASTIRDKKHHFTVFFINNFQKAVNITLIIFTDDGKMGVRKIPATNQTIMEVEPRKLRN